MSIGPEAKEAARKIVCGVYVISTKSGEKVNAMTAAWVMRTSFVPPLVTVAIGHARFSHDLILDSGVFAVNVLGPENVEAGRHFGLKSGRKVDKFEGVDWFAGGTGSPILADCAAWLDCKVRTHHEAGDHTLFVGEVLDGGVLAPDVSPLVYDRSSFFG